MQKRVLFGKTKKKKQKSGKGADDVTEPKWVYFKRLQFLDDFITAKNSRSNLQVLHTFMLCTCYDVYSLSNHIVLPWY